MIWLTSDTHFRHFNVISYSNRPFKTAEEMDEKILANFNEKIMPDDELYFLGDFVMGKEKLKGVYEYREKINCKNIYFCRGNHDEWSYKHKEQVLKDGLFKCVEDVIQIKYTSIPIFCSHYAHLVWPKLRHNCSTYHAFAHSHGGLKSDPTALREDVGVDTNNFYPYSLDDFYLLMADKTPISVDHH